MRRKYNEQIKWDEKFAYAVGLFTADGCLSPDGRHLEFCSKDKEQVLNFARCLNLKNSVCKKNRGGTKEKNYFRIQFGNKNLYEFLCSIGLSPRKSLTLQQVKTPDQFFADFLRGFFDGDGSFRACFHPESRNPQIRVRFCSASHQFIIWLQERINTFLGVSGFISKALRVEVLEYANFESLKLLSFMYYSPNIVYLNRKFSKVAPFLKSADVAELV